MIQIGMDLFQKSNEGGPYFPKIFKFVLQSKPDSVQVEGTWLILKGGSDPLKFSLLL